MMSRVILQIALGQNDYCKTNKLDSTSSSFTQAFLLNKLMLASHLLGNKIGEYSPT